MFAYLRQHESYIRQLLSEPGFDTDWQAVLAFHRVQLQFIQQERMVHLLITLAFAFFTLLSFAGFLFQPGLATGLLAAILLVLLGFYVVHYFHLENGVQRLYHLDRQLVCRCTDIPSPPWCGSSEAERPAGGYQVEQDD